MSRSKRDILETENMLRRLANVLAEHTLPQYRQTGQADTDAESLRRISMTLRRWFEMECGDSNNHTSWVITRGDFKPKPCTCGNGSAGCPQHDPAIPRADRREFVHDKNGRAFLERHLYAANRVTYNLIPDRETGARKRLAAIMARYPSLQAYVQTDPRGCALYILKPGDVPAGESADSYYSRGLAVFQ